MSQGQIVQRPVTVELSKLVELRDALLEDASDCHEAQPFVGDLLKRENDIPLMFIKCHFAAKILSQFIDGVSKDG